MIEETLAEAGEKMDKTVEAAKAEFAKVRTGRVNPGLFSSLTADYYGAPTPLQQLVSFNVEDARTVKIVPFDVTALAAIEKALRDSDLGVNPSNDGAAIRVVMPEMTAERRKEYTKLVNSKAEESRVSIRNVRRHAKTAIDKLVKDSEIGEDEGARAEKELDAQTKKHIDQVDALYKHKEAELLEV